METQILAFGDSITYGAWDEKGGWTARLREFIDKESSFGTKFYCEVYNLGVSGDTTDGLLKRFEAEAKARIGAGKIILIFDIGSNDSAWIHASKNNWVPPERFRANLKKLVKLARKFSSYIVFLEPTPADQGKVDPIPWAPDKSYRNELIMKFGEILKEVCDEEKVPFISQFESWSKDYKKLLNGDGMHPNSKGHQKIFEAVKEFLEKEKWLEA